MTQPLGAQEVSQPHPAFVKASAVEDFPLSAQNQLQRSISLKDWQRSCTSDDRGEAGDRTDAAQDDSNGNRFWSETPCHATPCLASPAE